MTGKLQAYIWTHSLLIRPFRFLHDWKDRLFANSCLAILCQGFFFYCSSQRKGTRIIGVWFQRLRGTFHWKWYWRIDFLFSLQVPVIINHPLPNVIAKTGYSCGQVCPTYRPHVLVREQLDQFWRNLILTLCHWSLL